MPKRSNTFQRLVKFINERLVDENWEVSESEMLIHSLNGEKREVDIVLRYKPSIGNYDPILISIECYDHKRSATSPWVEQMVKKHEFLPTSNLVLWSSNGFYKPALSLAEKYRVKTITSHPDADHEWIAISKIIKDGSLKVVFPEFTNFIDVIDLQGNYNRLDASEDYIFKVGCSGEIFTISQVKNCVINDEGLRTLVLDHATQENTDFWVQFIPPFECHVQDDNGDWVNPCRIGFGLKAYVEETSTIEAKSIYYENTLSTLAVAKFKNSLFEMFVQEKSGEYPKITSNVLKN